MLSHGHLTFDIMILVVFFPREYLSLWASIGLVLSNSIDIDHILTYAENSMDKSSFDINFLHKQKNSYWVMFILALVAVKFHTLSVEAVKDQKSGASYKNYANFVGFLAFGYLTHLVADIIADWISYSIEGLELIDAINILIVWFVQWKKGADYWVFWAVVAVNVSAIAHLGFELIFFKEALDHPEEYLWIWIEQEVYNIIGHVGVWAYFVWTYYVPEETDISHITGNAESHKSISKSENLQFSNLAQIV